MGKSDISLSISLDTQSYLKVLMKLTQLSEIDKSAAIEKGLTAASEPIVQQGKINLAQRNKKTGKPKARHLSQSFGTKLKKKNNSITMGFRRPGGAAAHLIDRGTTNRWTKKGAYRGSVSRGRPNTGSRFWTDAVLSNGEKALNILIDTIINEINEIANK